VNLVVFWVARACGWASGKISPVRFHGDLHIHSKYSRACSKDCDLEHLSWWARRKGIVLVGTGDVTHPAWFEHLRDGLVPAEPGLFRLRSDVEREVTRTLPPSLAAGRVRFMLSVEISTIYKRDERTRKVHHLVYLPGFDAAAEFNRRLGRIGNLGSDGRPILGLDSRDLLEITLECADGAYLVPAHIWTPWFAVLGSKSGFDAIEDCYADLADHIFALETGLSSDPAMNWRVSGLDRYRLVSNSDAHSPPILGREATVFDTELDYFAVRGALESGIGLAGTVEFFPEEGKYHVDGHRACGVRMEPSETRAHGGRCPKCGTPLTVGVLSRVAELADRPEGYRPGGATGFRNLVPLPEIMSEIMGTGPKSKTVLCEIDKLTAALGPELAILQDVPAEDLEDHSPLLAEAIARMRRGEVIRDAGYDGEYGVIRLFEPGELTRLRTAGTPALFDDLHPATPAQPARRERSAQRASTAKPKRRAPAASRSASPAGTPVPLAEPSVLAETPAPLAEPFVPLAETPVPLAEPSAPLAETSASSHRVPGASLLDGLDPEQRAAAEITDRPLLIIAGPGTGKTRTLTHRIAHLVTAHGVAPQHCLAITFTRRAADEMAHRLAALVPRQAPGLTIATFHSLGLRILREQHELAGLGADFRIATQAQRLAIATELTGSEKEARRLLTELSLRCRTTAAGRTEPSLVTEIAERYVKALRKLNLVDFDDLIALPVELLGSDPQLATAYRNRFRWVSVDEYQDIDEQQYRLLCHLAPPAAATPNAGPGPVSETNLTAIGDPDQAIYRFRGADVGFFLRFRQDFPLARMVHLTRNYRSGAKIVSAALQVISPTTLVPDRVLQATLPPPHTPIGLHKAATEQAEASFVVHTIERLLGGASFHSLDSGRIATADSHGGNGLDFSDFAVLYRTDRQAHAVMDALSQAGLPFQKRSHDRLVDRPAVDTILHELTYLPAGAEAAGAEAAGAEAAEVAGAEAAEAADAGMPVMHRVRRAARAALDRIPASDHELAAEIHTAVDLLAPLADRCGADLERFRNELLTGVEVDTWDPRADQITLLTLHSAKGLEFPVVFIIGCEDGILPLRWSASAPSTELAGEGDEEVAEERRLLFVGMTRAKRCLYISHAAERVRQGGLRTTSRSPFLDNLDPVLCEQVGDAAPRRQPRATQLRLL
jgi:uncharacterized protein (TIGR00375 family)